MRLQFLSSSSDDDPELESLRSLTSSDSELYLCSVLIYVCDSQVLLKAQIYAFLALQYKNVLMHIFENNCIQVPANATDF